MKRDKIDNALVHYHNKIFRTISNSDTGETSPETLFHYRQEGNLLYASYAGGKVRYGHLLGLVDEQGNIDMRYHQVNNEGEIMTGICHAKPEIMTNGKIRLHESWQWTSGDHSKGTSIVEEL